MKKLYISCPMKGRTEENIRKSIEKMHRIAEIVFDQELEVIPSYIEHKPPQDTNQAMWYLGESIKLMAQADYYIGIDYSDFFHGCAVENEIAARYGIQRTSVHVHELMPDVRDVEKTYWRNVEANEKRYHRPVISFLYAYRNYEKIGRKRTNTVQ